LLGQSLGGALVATEALLRFTPEVFLDTMGSAPTYLVARYLMGCRVGCYVHYPTISTDMLRLVERRETAYNNSATISKSVVLSRAKLIYYRMLAAGYGIAGRASHATMVNSSWTRGHIADIWGVSPVPHLVFPPCNTDNLRSIPLDDRRQLIISLGQFRPEKNHSLQIEAMAALRRRHPSCKARLVIIGSCRNAGDEQRVAAVNTEIEGKGLGDCIQVRVNVPWPELKGEWLRRAKVGLHTMVNEHFGINIVEFMAAGVVPIAHDSGAAFLLSSSPLPSSPLLPHATLALLPFALHLCPASILRCVVKRIWSQACGASSRCGRQWRCMCMCTCVRVCVCVCVCVCVARDSLQP
jgi:alpha-1,2-mannosyltransferase